MIRISTHESPLSKLKVRDGLSNRQGTNGLVWIVVGKTVINGGVLRSAPEIR